MDEDALTLVDAALRVPKKLKAQVGTALQAIEDKGLEGEWREQFGEFVATARTLPDEAGSGERPMAVVGDLRSTRSGSCPRPRMACGGPSGEEIAASLGRGGLRGARSATPPRAGQQAQCL